MLFCILTICLLHWNWSVSSVVGCRWRKFVFIWESMKSPLHWTREWIIITHLLEWVILLKFLLFSLLLLLGFFSHSSPHDFCSFFFSEDGYDRWGVISLIPGYGNPLSEHHYRKVELMLINSEWVILLTYSFNGGWLAVTVYHCHHNFIIFLVINLSSSH